MKRYICVGLLAGMAAVSGCATVGTVGESADKLIELTLEGAVINHKGDRKDLDIRLIERKGRWVAGFAKARRWNAATHRVDLSHFGRYRKQLAGEITVTLLPDAWIPQDRKPRLVSIDLDTTIGRKRITGTYAGRFADREVQGTVTGKAVPPPVIEPGDKAGLLRAFIPLPGGKRAEAVFRFEAKDGRVVVLDSDRILGSGQLAVTDDGLRGAATLQWDGMEPTAARFELSFIGREIGGAIHVGQDDAALSIPVGGRLELAADSALANRAEEGVVISDERKAIIANAAEAAKPLGALFAKHVYCRGPQRLPYRLFLPRMANQQPLPLVVFLHGAGGKGSDNEKHLSPWPKVWASDAIQSRFPCFVLVPHASSGWDSKPKAMPDAKVTNGKMVIEIVEGLAKQHVIDTSRIYVTGLSMGGWGTCYLLAEGKGTFAAGAPICGAEAKLARKIGTTPVWVFHGNADTCVPVGCSRDFVKALRKHGAEPLYTEYPMVGHGCYKWTYTDLAFYEWLFSQQRKR